jgi:uncharacterized protein (TIGR03435 family)
MLGYKKTIAVCLACTLQLCAQSFEVASIKPNRSASNAMGMFPSPGKLRIQNYPLRQLIAASYGHNFDLKTFQVMGGPAWLDSDRYDIEAKAEGNANFWAMLPMLKTLLTDRFALRTHKEIRSLPVYELTVAKGGLKMHESAEGDDTKQRSTIREHEFTGHKVNMTLLSDWLAGELGRPVVDETRLSGKYDFSLKYTPEGTEAADANVPSGASLFTAIQEQMGLKLTAGKGPVEVIVIDSVERPSSN